MEYLRIRFKRIEVLLAALTVGLALAGQSEASQVADIYSGDFNGATTLGGVALGADTGFTYTAVFDNANNLFLAPGMGVFAVTEFTITIDGHGTYQGIPDSNLNVALFDPLNGAGILPYGVGLMNQGLSSGFIAEFGSATPAMDATAPQPSQFSGFGGYYSLLPYTINLVGVNGGQVLVIDNFGSVTPTNLLVPEPSALALTGAGIISLCLWMRRRPRLF